MSQELDDPVVQEATDTETVENPVADDSDAGQAPAEEHREQDNFMERELKRARREAAEARVKLRQLQQELEKYRQAEMSEKERLQVLAQQAQEKAAELERLLRQERAVAAVTQIAAITGLDPRLAVKLIDVQFDEDGNPDVESIEQQAKKLASDYPGLLVRPATGRPANPDRSTERRSLTLDDIRRMSPDEINRRWNEVQDVLSRGR